MDLKRILHDFNLDKIKEIKELAGGMVNESFLLRGSSNNYVVQKISEKTLQNQFGKVNYEAVVKDRTENYNKIYEILNKNNLAIPKLYKKGNNYYLRSQDFFLLVYEYIPNRGEAIRTSEALYSAGNFLGKFHSLMSREKIIPRYSIINFHQTSFFLDKLKKIYQAHQGNKSKRVKKEFEFLISQAGKNTLPADLPELLIHSDPRLDNFLFRDRRVVGLIDFEAMMVGNQFFDIGDALRDWGRNNFMFKKELFLAGLAGYSSGFKKKIDIKLALKSAKLIAVELATRYLIDYFEESYFTWDKTKFSGSAEHNLYRCQEEEIKYLKSINM